MPKRLEFVPSRPLPRRIVPGGCSNCKALGAQSLVAEQDRRDHATPTAAQGRISGVRRRGRVACSGNFAKDYGAALSPLEDVSGNECFSVRSAPRRIRRNGAIFVRSRSRDQERFCETAGQARRHPLDGREPAPSAEGRLRRLPPNYMEYIALMLGSGTRLKAVPTEPTSPPFPPDPLGWMAV